MRRLHIDFSSAFDNTLEICRRLGVPEGYAEIIHLPI